VGVHLAGFAGRATLNAVLRYTTIVSLISGLLGWGHCAINRPSPTLAYLSNIAYPFYILHQTVIVFIGYYVVRWNLAVGFKFAWVVVASGGITLGLCELARRWRVTRAILGMKQGV
jgi:glucans biosynthesis protein C